MPVTPTESGEAGAISKTRQESFERLLRPRLRRLHRLAFRLADSAAEAEDLLREVLLKLFRRADELSSISSSDLRSDYSRHQVPLGIQWEQRF